MRIGIKFCGGCNPKYDRSKVAEILKEKINKKYKVEYVRDNETYDFVFIINGCQVACASREGFIVLKKSYTIFSLSSFEKILDEINFMV